MPTTDHSALCACVESVISQRPVLFVQDGQINAAVLGIVMPYRILTMSIIACLYGVSPIALKADLKHNSKLNETMIRLQAGIAIPARFAQSYQEAPWLAAHVATRTIFSDLRAHEDRNSKIIEWLRAVVQAHQDLYQPMITTQAQEFLMLEEISQHPSLEAALTARQARQQKALLPASPPTHPPEPPIVLTR